MGSSRIGTQAEFARFLGVSRQHVHNLIRQGRIPVRKDRKIDFSKAQAAIEKHAEPSRDHVVRRDRPARSNGGGSSAAPAAGAEPEPDPEPDKTPAPDAGDGRDSDFWRSRARREQLRAEREELELSELRGGVIRRQDVEAAAYRGGRLIRDRILAIPDRISPQLASTRSERQVRRLLRAELRAVLEELEHDLAP